MFPPARPASSRVRPSSAVQRFSRTAGLRYSSPAQRGEVSTIRRSSSREGGRRGGIGRFPSDSTPAIPAELREAAAGKVAPEDEGRRQRCGQLCGGEVEESGGGPLVKGLRDPGGDLVGKGWAVTRHRAGKRPVPRGYGQCDNGHGRQSGLSGFLNRREYRKTTAASQEEGDSQKTSPKKNMQL